MQRLTARIKWQANLDSFVKGTHTQHGQVRPGWGNKADFFCSVIFPRFFFQNYWNTGPWFNIKMSSYQYRKSHCGDKTVVRSSYLHNGISYTGKMTSLYWFSPLVICMKPHWYFLGATKVQQYNDLSNAWLRLHERYLISHSHREVMGCVLRTFLTHWEMWQ